MILALIAAAGSGSRTGLNENKIFFTLEDGKTVIEKTVNTFCNTVTVVIKCAGVDLFELMGNSSTFDHFLQAGGNDVVFHSNAMFKAVGADAVKPFGDTGEQFYFCTVGLQCAFCK